MIWDEAGRLALLELLCSGRLRRRKAQSAAWDHLVALAWTRRTRRRDELELVDAAAVEGLLSRVWPCDAFAAECLAPGLVDWPVLENRRRRAAADRNREGTCGATRCNLPRKSHRRRFRLTYDQGSVRDPKKKDFS